MIGLTRIVDKRLSTLIRNYSSATPKVVEVTQDDKTGITTVSMQKAPVNSINLELCSALKAAFLEAVKNQSKGIILTSSLPKIFSAGLDIMEMYKPDMTRASNFWHTLQDTWATLYGLEIPVVAAINGASPAGGCLLAISCEYRVFVDGKHSIGLNETQLGIIAPKWFREVYIDTIGYRQAELSLLRGSLYPPQEALKIGLVDELASDKADAIKKCQNYISSFENISGKARGLTKLQLRTKLLSWLKENREKDAKEFLTYIQLPKVQTGLQMYIEFLKQKQ